MRLLASSLLLLLLSISVWAEVDDCGRSNYPNKLSRVMGGNESPLGKWPWQVELMTASKDFICGGSIIADRWILTAAHCFDFHTPTARYILHGTVERGNRIDKSDRSKAASVKNIIVHEEYFSDGFRTFLSDIALIELNETINFDNNSSAICLPSLSTTIPPYAQVVATGFGIANEYWVSHNAEVTHITPNLRESIFPLIPLHICDGRMNETLGDAKLCGGSLSHGAAPGDSGGPLVIYSKSGRWFQIGVTSYGDNKHSKLFEQDLNPGVYTNVEKYCAWIEEKTRGEAKCRDGGELIDATRAFR